MDPFTVIATAGLVALAGAAAVVRSERERRRPALLPVRVRKRRRG